MDGKTSEAPRGSQPQAPEGRFVLDFGCVLRPFDFLVSETNALRYQPKENDPYSSHARILERVGEGNGRRLLDVGSAQGALAQRFTERKFEVTCIEGNPELAAAAEGKCHQMIVADLDRELPQLTGQFDVIVYGDILEHLRNPLEVFMGFNRLLSPSGKVIVSVPNFVHLFVRLNILCGRFEYMDRGILDHTHLRFFTLASFKRFLAQAGLTVEELVVTPAPLLLMVPSRYHGWWLRCLHGINAWLARLWKTMFGYQFVAVARPRKVS